jgi:uncharacterized membrane protein YqiK
MVSTIVTISIIAVAVFATIAALVSRYKRCPSDKVLVVYGKVGKNANGQSTAKCIHGGASFIWPVIQDFAFMDLKPMALDVNLQNALSKQNIRLNVPSTYTVAINTEASYVNNAAKSLMKAGELAKAAGVLVTTIRFYTKEGLLKSDAESQGGYNLYQPEKALSTIRLINSLKEKRYTLTEIKALLTHQIMAERGVS